MHKRVLILGPTGVQKSEAISRLQDHVVRSGRWQAQESAIRSLRYVNFESNFLEKAAAPWRSWAGFLNNQLPTQNMLWLKAWNAFADTLDNDAVTVLGLHAVYASGVYGIRSACDIERIAADFRPTLVITLVDDVFNTWRRTEGRAGGRDIKGRPKIEQMLSARRAEQLIGDMIALKASSPLEPVSHIFFSVGNSLDALANLMLGRARVTYLSFPISAPRQLLASGDNSLEQVINHAHRLAQDEMAKRNDRCFISPLTIDELPFAGAAEAMFAEVQKAKDAIRGAKRKGKQPKAKIAAVAEVTQFQFLSTARWSLSELWGGESLICVPPPSGDFLFPVEDVVRASAIIRTDVGWRDRRLVQQADSLAIVCPKHPLEERITRGVESEIAVAGGLGIDCTVWQDLRWDPSGFVQTKLRAEAGTMGDDPDKLAVHIVDSIENVIQTS